MVLSSQFTNSEQPGNCSFLKNRFRYAILLLTNLCLTSICSNMIAFNFTMILMKKDIEDPNLSANANSTIISVLYSQQDKAKLLYAVSLASIAATFPFSVLYTKFGAHLVFFFAGILSAVSTALVPLAASQGMPVFMAVRTFQGVAFAANFAAIGMVCSRWASLRQHGFFFSCMTNFSQMAVIITNPIAAALSESPHFGWEYVYYVHAAAGPVLFSLWLCLYSDYPDKHKCVSSKELEQIQRDKSQAHIQIHGYMPYKAICTNRVILVVWLNAFADIVSAIFLLTYLPTYISKVLGYGVQTTGFYSSLPALVHIPLKVICGWFSDTIKCISEVNKMRICNTIALCGSAFFFALVGFVPDDYPFISVLFMTLNYATVATNCGGFYKCGSLVSRQYVHFVIANVQFLKCFTLFISPLLVSLFVIDESSKTEWRTIFLGMSVVLFIANALFCYVVTDQPAEFTKKSIEKGCRNRSFTFYKSRHSFSVLFCKKCK